MVVAFLNVGNFLTGAKDGKSGSREPEFYTLSSDFIKEHHDNKSVWQKVRLSGVLEEIEQFKNELGFELIAEQLGIPPLSR